MTGFMYWECRETDVMKKFVISSRDVAEIFGKSHKNVLRSITNFIKSIQSFDDDDLSDFVESGFIINTYSCNSNNHYPEYLLTEEAFTIIAISFKGDQALRFKLDFINKYNEKERYIDELLAGEVTYH